jgi:hypothetical protein
LASAYVALVRGDSVVSEALTGDDGTFVLRSPGEGSFTVRAELLGYRTAETGVRVASGGVEWVPLAMEPEPIELEGLVAAVTPRCDLGDASDAGVARIWAEVTKALQVLNLTELQQLYRLSGVTWRRALHPASLWLLPDSRREERSFETTRPFRSADADVLRGGYVQEAPEGGWSYFAPDAETLLSDHFLETHCFALDRSDGSGEEERPVGLRFRPRTVDAPDIEGVLWLDPRTWGPLRLEFSYTHLPWPITNDRIGGDLDFCRLPGGHWIVTNWRIRMPVVSATGRGSRRRYRVDQLTEAGGRVDHVATARGQADAGSEGDVAAGNLLPARCVMGSEPGDASREWDSEPRVSRLPPRDVPLERRAWAELRFWKENIGKIEAGKFAPGRRRSQWEQRQRPGRPHSLDGFRKTS